MPAREGCASTATTLWLGVPDSADEVVDRRQESLCNFGDLGFERLADPLWDGDVHADE